MTSFGSLSYLHSLSLLCLPGLVSLEEDSIRMVCHTFSEVNSAVFVRSDARVNGFVIFVERWRARDEQISVRRLHQDDADRQEQERSVLIEQHQQQLRVCLQTQQEKLVSCQHLLLFLPTYSTSSSSYCISAAFLLNHHQHYLPVTSAHLMENTHRHSVPTSVVVRLCACVHVVQHCAGK